MKKTGIIFVVLCLALSLIGIFSAEAQAQLTLQLSSAEASRGEDVTLVLSASNNPGVSYLSLMFEYDKTRLAFNGFDHAFSASDFPGTWSENGMIINWLGAENIMYEGEILKLNFTVLDDAGPGDAVVNVSADPDDDPALQKSEDGPDGVDVDVDYGAGKVTIPEESVPLPESITLDQNSAELEAGDTLVLTAEILPEEADQSVTWESSDPDVASVDENGTVTAISEGTATITATSDADDSLYDSCVITVPGTEEPEVLPESIALNQNTAELEAGDTLALTAEILPEGADQSVTWESSDPDVASVDENGTVTAISEGTATITATSDTDDSLSDSCVITVNEPEEPVVLPESIELDQTSVELEAGDTLVLTAEILPEEADQSVTWESSDPDVASVDENGTVTAISEGTATITATSDADESLSDSCVITVIGTENPGILPESIALAGAAPSSLAIGEGTRISATILPEEADQTVIWESSDPNVATVDEDGVITAVGEGAVTIRGFSQVDPRLVVAVRISVTGREPEQEQPRQPEPDRTFWKLHENDILPRTGFSAIRPQAIGSLPLDITYEPLRWSIEIPSANVKSDIVEVPFVDGEYPVTWLGSDLGLLEDSSLPGDGTAVLVGHNHLNTTDAGPLAFLDLLEEDTRIFVHDPRNNIRIFVVYANEKVSETDVRAVEKLAMEAENSLILITCEDELVGGGYANRRIIAAKPY